MNEREPYEQLDEISMESFPASDPAGHSTVTGVRGRIAITDPVPVEHDAQARRFQARYPEGAAFLQYNIDSGVMALLHSETPDPLRHRGIASRILVAALEYAHEQGLRVVPVCPFVTAYLDHHPEYDSLIAE